MKYISAVACTPLQRAANVGERTSSDSPCKWFPMFSMFSIRNSIDPEVPLLTLGKWKQKHLISGNDSVGRSLYQALHPSPATLLMFGLAWVWEIPSFPFLCNSYQRVFFVFQFHRLKIWYSFLLVYHFRGILLVICIALGRHFLHHFFALALPVRLFSRINQIHTMRRVCVCARWFVVHTT